MKLSMSLNGTVRFNWYCKLIYFREYNIAYLFKVTYILRASKCVKLQINVHLLNLKFMVYDIYICGLADRQNV